SNSSRNGSGDSQTRTWCPASCSRNRSALRIAASSSITHTVARGASISFPCARRQLKRELGPTLHPRDMEPTSVGFDYRTADRQPKSHPLALGCEKRVEQPLPHRLGQPGPVVTHRHPHAPIPPQRLQDHHPLLLGSVAQ